MEHSIIVSGVFLLPMWLCVYKCLIFSDNWSALNCLSPSNDHLSTWKRSLRAASKHARWDVGNRSVLRGSGLRMVKIQRGLTGKNDRFVRLRYVWMLYTILLWYMSSVRLVYVGNSFSCRSEFLVYFSNRKIFCVNAPKSHKWYLPSEYCDFCPLDRTRTIFVLFSLHVDCGSRPYTL